MLVAEKKLTQRIHLIGYLNTVALAIRIRIKNFSLCTIFSLDATQDNACSFREEAENVQILPHEAMYL